MESGRSNKKKELVFILLYEFTFDLVNEFFNYLGYINIGSKRDLQEHSIGVSMEDLWSFIKYLGFTCIFWSSPIFLKKIQI